MIQFANPSADLFIPDETEPSQALGRTTHLGVGAHQDDLEVMALHGILACYKQPQKWFGGVTVTNGAGSSRTNEYADYTDEQMQVVRAEEQRKAAVVGEFGFVAQLGYPSSAVKQPENSDYAADLQTILAAAGPQVVYTHNLADKHDTHVAVVVPLIRALRELPEDERPAEVYGVEVWRDLNWLLDDEKVLLIWPTDRIWCAHSSAFSIHRSPAANATTSRWKGGSVPTRRSSIRTLSMK